jgi:asparagine synthase (glutamine-hydrolysing)
MSDLTGRWTITFNGEIYNYRAVRASLEQLGYGFKTNSDTEVLINTVAEWGAAGLKRVRGMYAFALWDSYNRELWLARDPFGIKPLYVAHHHGLVWFASQARALADCAPVDNKRDPAALSAFYIWGHVPEPFSWWEGIHMFPPGCAQRFPVGRAAHAPERFYDIPQTLAEAQPHEIGRQELQNAVKDAVLHHLVADIPVGVFLSAGIDSNVVAALAAEAQPGKALQTVTLAFEEYAGTPHDEAPLAEAAAKQLGSDHATVRIGKEEFEAWLDHFFSAMDQPSIDGLNTYLISRAAAAQGLKVVLSGLGGDELFGGYPSFWQVPMLASSGRFIPATKYLREKISNALIKLMPRSVSPKLAAAIRHSGDLGSSYLLRRSLYLLEELSALLDESWLKLGLEKLQTHESLQELIAPLADAHRTPYSQVSTLEMCWYMRSMLLRDSDWASMAHGLELRVPFVDTTLLERLAPAICSPSPPTKRDLASCASHLSLELVSRRKTGFTTPVARWIESSNGNSIRGLRGWADNVHRRFRTNSILPQSPLALPLGELQA